MNDDELRVKLKARMLRPTGLAAAREFLQTYVCDSDLGQLEGMVRHMMRVNPITVLDGANGLDAILDSPQEPETYAHLVAFDANRAIDDPSDVGAKAWLAQLRDRVRCWIADAESRA